MLDDGLKLGDSDDIWDGETDEDGLKLGEGEEPTQLKLSNFIVEVFVSDCHVPAFNPMVTLSIPIGFATL